ncbi:MAG: hypothetical protein KJP01_02130 [Gramella sp.]|nr:hypothetical protein [Christiangramia sp.]MBT8318909.1 hypothetical protein [Christiangramia sp.]
MKRIQFLLFAVIFTAMATKVSITPEKKAGYAVLSLETKAEHVQQFFKYKVHNIQSEKLYNNNCMIRKPMCCHT